MFYKWFVFFFFCQNAFSSDHLEKDTRGLKKREREELFTKKKSRKKNKDCLKKKQRFTDFDDHFYESDDDHFDRKKKKNIREVILRFRNISSKMALDSKFDIQYKMNQKIVNLIETNKELQNESLFRGIFYLSQLEILKHEIHQEHLLAKKNAESFFRKEKWTAYKALNEKHKQMIAFFIDHQNDLPFAAQSVLKKAKIKVLQFEITQMSSSPNKEIKSEYWDEIRQKNTEILNLDHKNIKAKVGLLIDQIRVCHQKGDFANKEKIMNDIIQLTPNDPHTKAKILRHQAYTSAILGHPEIGVFLLQEILKIDDLDNSLCSEINEKIKKFSNFS